MGQLAMLLDVDRARSDIRLATLGFVDESLDCGVTNRRCPTGSSPPKRSLKHAVRRLNQHGAPKHWAAAWVYQVLCLFVSCIRRLVFVMLQRTDRFHVASSFLFQWLSSVVDL